MIGQPDKLSYRLAILWFRYSIWFRYSMETGLKTGYAWVFEGQT